MKIDKDDRTWEVTLKLSNNNCPHLYFPANIHACKLLEKICAQEERCRMEICPMRSKP